MKLISRPSHIASETGKPRIWIHFSSEEGYAITSPLVERFVTTNHFSLLLTSGADIKVLPASIRRQCAAVPANTTSGLLSFISKTKPSVAIFTEIAQASACLPILRHEDIPIYLIAERLPAGALWKWWPFSHRKRLQSFTRIFAFDDRSGDRFRRMGIKSVTICGSPLLEKIGQAPQLSLSNAVIGSFASTGDFVFVGAELHSEKDLSLAASVANAHPNIKCIFIPHNICEDTLNRIKYLVEGHTMIYSECAERTIPDSVQVLVIDYLTPLASLLPLASCAYVGTGANPVVRPLLECVAHSVPVSLSSSTGSSCIIDSLRHLGVIRNVKSCKDINRWVTALTTAPTTQQCTHDVSRLLMACSKGATEKIFLHITDCLQMTDIYI